MSVDKKLTKKIVAECGRIEEDSEQSAKRHFNAASRWSTYNKSIGIPSVVLGAIASAVSFSSLSILGGLLAAATASLTAVLTFLKPSERSNSHTSSGNQYLRLRNEVRIFREIDLPAVNNEDDIRDELKHFAQRRDDLNESAPITATKDYSKANKGIEDGETEYKADKHERK